MAVSRRLRIAAETMRLTLAVGSSSPTRSSTRPAPSNRRLASAACASRNESGISCQFVDCRPRPMVTRMRSNNSLCDCKASMIAVHTLRNGFCCASSKLTRAYTPSSVGSSRLAWHFPCSASRTTPAHFSSSNLRTFGLSEAKLMSALATKTWKKVGCRSSPYSALSAANGIAGRGDSPPLAALTSSPINWVCRRWVSFSTRSE